MQHRSALIAIALLVSLSVSVALAQHNHSASATQASASESQTGPMQECRKHQAESIAALDQATTNLAEAKQLSDPDQMKAAIDSAQKQIAEAKHHLSMCPMAQGGGTNHSGIDHSQHKMKCMEKDARSE